MTCQLDDLLKPLLSSIKFALPTQNKFNESNSYSLPISASEPVRFQRSMSECLGNTTMSTDRTNKSDHETSLLLLSTQKVSENPEQPHKKRKAGTGIESSEKYSGVKEGPSRKRRHQKRVFTISGSETDEVEQPAYSYVNRLIKVVNQKIRSLHSERKNAAAVIREEEFIIMIYRIEPSSRALNVSAGHLHTERI